MSQYLFDEQPNDSNHSSVQDVDSAIISIKEFENSQNQDTTKVSILENKLKDANQ